MIVDAATVRMYLQLPIDFDQTDELINRLIEEVEAHMVMIQGMDFETDDSDEPIYPVGYESTAAYMVGWNLKMRHGLKSLNTGDYSQTTEDMIQGYPKDLVFRIKRFLSVH